jgi:hypothetical protein
MASLAVILLLVLVAILTDVITPYNPYAQTFDPTLPPSAQHWLGTDELGRDELSRVILGARISLGISAGATVVAVCIGLLVGMIAGYRGRVVDNLLMHAKRVARIVEIATLLAAQPRHWTRARLAAKYELCERQIARDLEVLRHGLGYRIERTRDGYVIQGAPALPRLTLTMPECWPWP